MLGDRTTCDANSEASIQTGAIVAILSDADNTDLSDNPTVDFDGYFMVR